MNDLVETLTRGRAERLAALRADLLPRIRLLNPDWSDEAVATVAARMAEYRLADEETGRAYP